VALGQPTSCGEHRVSLRRVFDSLGDHVETQRVAQADHGAVQRTLAWSTSAIHWAASSPKSASAFTHASTATVANMQLALATRNRHGPPVSAVATISPVSHGGISNTRAIHRTARGRPRRRQTSGPRRGNGIKTIGQTAEIIAAIANPIPNARWWPHIRTAEPAPSREALAREALWLCAFETLSARYCVLTNDASTRVDRSRFLTAGLVGASSVTAVCSCSTVGVGTSGSTLV
jgi:hypothetical protein